jgi:hypothetical protein
MSFRVAFAQHRCWTSVVDPGIKSGGYTSECQVLKHLPLPHRRSPWVLWNENLWVLTMPLPSHPQENIVILGKKCGV